MASYNQRVTEGEITSWLRAYKIELHNTEPPILECYEQDRTVIPDGTIINRSTDVLKYTMTDPTDTIPLIDPDTFEATEDHFTAGQFWLMAASTYMFLARRRDEINRQNAEMSLNG
jgi:hypothetical protein